MLVVLFVVAKQAACRTLFHITSENACKECESLVCLTSMLSNTLSSQLPRDDLVSHDVSVRISKGIAIGDISKLKQMPLKLPKCTSQLCMHTCS